MRSFSGSSSAAIKLHNQRAILLTLLHQERVSRVQIAELTGLSTTTITNLITELLDLGIVQEEGTEQRGVGRPRTGLRLVPEARGVVGIYIGVGRVQVALTDLFARPICTLAFEHPLDQPASDVLDHAADLAAQVIQQSGLDPRLVLGVGVGASGLVDPQTGVNVLAPNLGWHDEPLRDDMARRLNLPVFVDNNVRAMALAESLFGAGQNVYALAFVYARVGVGAGFVVGGQVYRGGAGAGEIGHMTLLADGGDPCRCGSTGCLETLVSEPVIVRLAQQIAALHPRGLLADTLRQGDQPVLARIFEAARAGDEAARAMLDQRARYMGIALANLVNTFSPELILLGGLFAEGQDILFPVVQQTLRERAFAGLGESVRLQVPTFGAEAGVIGAAALALDAFFYEQSEVAR